MKLFIARKIKVIKEFNKIAEIDEIARRYFAMNSFDGVLMILGILIANLFALVYEKRIILVTSIGAIVAVTISGMWGAYMTESAERTGQIKKLEKRMGMSLKKTPIHKAHRFATFFLSLVNGISSLLVGIVILSPFFISSLSIKSAYFLAIGFAFSVLFSIGVFLGKISKTRLITSGLKILASGIVCVAVIFLIEKLRVA